MSIEDLVLGTVQIGTPYGIANTSGMPDEQSAIELVRLAIAEGIVSLDTARAYGQSEARIGAALAGQDFQGEIITKLSPLADLDDAGTPDEIEARVRQDVETSQHLLGGAPLDYLLLHRADHLTQWGGKVWQTLQRLRDAGHIKKLGVSVQSPAEAKRAFATPDVSLIQLPMNLLDWRWHEDGIDRLAREHIGVRVHVRSLYLQGLLVAGKPALFPDIKGVNPAALIAALEACATDLNRTSLADLCVSYMRSLDWIDGLVIGMETTEQLQDNLKLFRASLLGDDERRSVDAALPRVPEILLNPALWPK